MTDLNLQIPGYHIKRELGRGGMAIVYLALQESLDRQVALKVIKPALTADEEFARRFLREGRIIASLNNPYIVTVYDIAAHEGTYYLSMEYLPGATLKERIQAGLSLEQGLDIIRDLASALNYAHQRGVIHRDIKPQNILFRENDQPVLTDFGIAKTLGGSTIMTRTGLSLGTPRYMSPEQIRGQKTDSRADLYSLGVLFYEMLTGDAPYTAEDSFALAMMHVTAPIPPLPPELKRFQPVLDRLLEKDPDQRFQTAQEFLTALDHPETLPARPLNLAEITAAQPVPADLPAQPVRRASRLAALVATVLAGIALAGGGYLYWSQSSAPPTTADTSTTRPPAEQANALLAQARRQQQTGDLAQSRALVEQGLQLAPDHTELAALRAELERQQAQIDQQQRTMLQAEQLFDQAQRAYQEGALETGMARVDQGLQAAPQHAGLLALKQQIQEQQLARQKQEAARQQAMTEKQHQAEISRLRAESEKRYQMELDRLRAELEAQQRQAEQDRQRAQAEQERRRAEAEEQRRAAADAQRQAEQERRRAEAEEQRRAAADEQRQAEQERRRTEAEDRRRAEAEAQEQRRAEQERQRIAAEERRKAEQERRRTEAEEQDRRRAEAEAQEQRRAEQERQRAETAVRRQAEQQRPRTEGERQDRMRAEAEEQQRREDEEWARSRATRGQSSSAARPSASATAELPPISLISPDQAPTNQAPPTRRFYEDTEARQPPETASPSTARQAWELARNSQNPADLEQFIANYPKERKLVATARARLKQLQANPALLVRLVVRSNQKGTEVSINGQSAGVTPFTKELPPGNYHLQVQRPGYEEWTKEVTLTTEDEEVRLTVPLLRKQAEADDAPAPRTNRN